jgi:hypothetical protein
MPCFVINVFTGTKYCPPPLSSILERVCIRGHTRKIRNFIIFSCSSSHSPSARCVSAANTICKYIDIFNNSSLSVKGLIHQSNQLFFDFCCFLFVLSCVILFLVLFSCWFCNWPLAVELRKELNWIELLFVINIVTSYGLQLLLSTLISILNWVELL